MGWAGLLLLAACNQDLAESLNPLDQVSTDWLIPPDQVFDGGPGKDGIPALSDPQFIAASDVHYLAPADLVIGYRVGDVIKAYPHPILDWHEIANDQVDGQPVAITYCPLTGSALAWSREINGVTTTFGVSGKLYNNNLMPYDRETGSYWSQMRMDCVHGDNIGTQAEVFQVIETTWQTWQAMFPGSQVMSNRTGVYGEEAYATYPYGTYRTDGRILFPLREGAYDGRLHIKERLLGVVADDKVRFYRLDSFQDSIRVIHDGFPGLFLAVVGSQADNILMIFNRQLQDGTLLNFSAVQEQLPGILLDNEGTTWDVLGRGIAGPRTGQQLSHPVTYIAYWFAWTSFYDNIDIFEFDPGELGEPLSQAKGDLTPPGKVGRPAHRAGPIELASSSRMAGSPGR